MSTLVITPCMADANARAACHPRPLGGPLCVGSTTCAIPLRSSPLGLRLRFVRDSEFTRRSIRGPRADSEKEERPIRTEGNGRVGGLDELDTQLRSLSSDNVKPVARQASKGDVENWPVEEKKRVAWPVFGEGFVLYVSVGLVLLTIINNLLFRLFIGPPVVRVPVIPGREGTPSDGAERERYRVRSYKDPKYKYYKPPPVTDGPLS